MRHKHRSLDDSSMSRKDDRSPQSILMGVQAPWDSGLWQSVGTETAWKCFCIVRKEVVL